MNPVLSALALMAALGAPALADSTIVPDPTLTPGAIRTVDSAEICSHGTRELRHWDRARDDRIMAEYGLPTGPHPDWEIDHLIPLGIGGADDEANLWPEPRRSVEPTWNAERKDRLEWKLRELICDGQLDVHEAQRIMAEDWTEAYAKYFRAAVNISPPGTLKRRPRTLIAIDPIHQAVGRQLQSRLHVLM
jgi:hypothetical protein